MGPVTPDEMEAVRDMVNRFMQTEVAPVMDGYERRGEFPRDLIAKAGEVGLYGAVFPEALGGTNLGYLAATVIQEEMARNDVRFAACNNQQGSTCPSCIYFVGIPEQINRYVPNLLENSRSVAEHDRLRRGVPSPAERRTAFTEGKAGPESVRRPGP